MTVRVPRASVVYVWQGSEDLGMSRFHRGDIVFCWHFVTECYLHCVRREKERKETIPWKCSSLLH